MPGQSGQLRRKYVLPVKDLAGKNFVSIKLWITNFSQFADSLLVLFVEGQGCLQNRVAKDKKH